ncbi:ankyrin repeat domain-containing protein [Solirubrobacter deserti]|uniref:Ankyrin repeat domain-containing protein n=1 Tax=Solirubrobacter deserti TaxID=2282478 RepID=A0ABT4RQD2_9ACTN|nr:ankyrin repeat domain-containing protein [Solirubrobacter deserti]MDA0140623.1 ankyrin repeat domain-containing protein [Solirubrobacter deserti]
MATARPDGARTLLHSLVDWPGHRDRAVELLALLVEAGADVNARFGGPEHDETPLHWAASNDDVLMVDALLDAGADIDARGGVIGGGTPLDDAWAFGQWRAARRLVERGATPSFLAACALGLPLGEGDATQGLWAAAHGGSRENAELLLARGADPQWVGWDDLTPEAAARRSGFTELADFLREPTKTDHA